MFRRPKPPPRQAAPVLALACVISGAAGYVIGGWFWGLLASMPFLLVAACLFPNRLALVIVVGAVACVLGFQADGPGMYVAFMVVIALIGVYWIGYWPVPTGPGMGPPVPPTGPEAALIGRSATVVAHVEAGVWVSIEGRDWPAKLTPFSARPDIGSLVRVERVYDGILVVRPGA